MNCLELFAGAGGLALGLHQAGFKIVGAVEFDKYACETLRQNDFVEKVIEADITKIDNIKDYITEDIDLISGGFPCQTFSYAGARRGFADTRGTLFHDYARILTQVKPKMFIAENVKGLLSHDKGRTFETIYNTFKEIGYDITYKVLNSADYGVPQKRERLIIVGVRADLRNKFKFEKFKPLLYVLKSIKRRVADGCHYIPYSEEKKRVLEQVPAGGCWRDLPDDVAKEYMGKAYYSGGGRTGMARRLSWEKPSPTLTTSPNQKQTELCHLDETRPLSIEEYAAIQTFPKDYKFAGSIRQVYKQIGNAVPVELAFNIGGEIIHHLTHCPKYIERAVIRDDVKKRYIYTTKECAQSSEPYTRLAISDAEAKYFYSFERNGEIFDMDTGVYTPRIDASHIWLVDMDEHKDLGVVVGEVSMLQDLMEHDDVTDYKFYRDDQLVREDRQAKGLNNDSASYYYDDDYYYDD